MRKLLWGLFILSVSGVAHGHQVVRGDDHIKEILIQKYISSHSQACPCPYSRGPNCKKNNSYTSSKVKNAYCYPHDIPASKIKAFKEINGIHSH